MPILLQRLLIYAALAYLISLPATVIVGGVMLTRPGTERVDIDDLRRAMQPGWDTTFLGASREVMIPIGTHTRLAATVFGGGSYATIVVLHPAGGTRIDALPAAYAFWSEGFDVVLLDRRAHGSSDGEVLPLFADEQADLRAVVDQLLVSGWTGTGRFGLFGMGDGGTACVLAAAGDERIDAVAAEDPPATAAEHVRTALAERFGVPAPLFTLHGLAGAYGVSLLGGVDVAALDARPAIAALQKPALLVESASRSRAAAARGFVTATSRGGWDVLRGGPDAYVAVANFFHRVL